jgi:cell wall-active antibiotic response 4TMS protein YvqF
MSVMHESAVPHTDPGRPEAPPLYARAQVPVPPPQPIQMRDPRAKSSSLAAVLSLVPGLGQVYVGYYQRGFIHAVVVAGIITLLAGETLGQLEPMFALFMVFFWLYNVIDASRRATLYNLYLAGNPTVGLPEDFMMPRSGGSIFGGACLIAIGGILLLHTRFGMPLDWTEQWWPVAPMIFGVYLLAQAIRERRPTSGAGRRGSRDAA